MSTRNIFAAWCGLLVILVLSACGGGGSSSTTTVAITGQPTDQSVVAGTIATFDVVARHATGYQWQSSSDDGTTFADVAGATSASYTTPVTALADSGTRYRVVVSGAKNNVTSSAASLTVTPAPEAPWISVQPADQTVAAGQDVSFSVTASGTAPSYQWQQSADDGVNFTDIASSDHATLTLAAVPLAHDGYRYRVVVSNGAGNVTSNAARLTVNAVPALPVFTTQPGNDSVLAPDPATFHVVVTGTPTPTLQWQLSTDGGASFDDVAGATGSSYTTPTTSAGDNGNRYRVIATNSVGAATSAVATLSVTAPSMPSFTTEPEDVAVTAGGNAQFTVAVSGTPTPSLQWQFSADSGGTWGNINGATAAVFNVVNAALGNDGRQFRAVATNSVGVVNSRAATLTVTPAAAVSITTTSPLPVGTVNTPYSVTLAASGGTPPYTWSVADGYTLPVFLTLNASTGVISGTPPNVEAMSGWAIRVADSANPPNTNQQHFDLEIQALCDTGRGSTTVDGAPVTVGGKFCPGSVYTQFEPYANGTVMVAWTETYPYGGGTYYESVGVVFYPVTGVVDSVMFHLNDATRLSTYTCAAVGTADYPTCSGVTVNPATGEVSFENTTVGSGSSTPFTLNGLLFYVP